MWPFRKKIDLYGFRTDENGKPVFDFMLRNIVFIVVRQSGRWIDVIASPHSAILACIRMGVHNRRATSSSRESAPFFQPPPKRVLTFA